jgi:hypothetical protein
LRKFNNSVTNSSDHAAYCLKASDQRAVLEQAASVFDLVWRVDFSAPGFCSIDVGPAVDAHALRSAMVGLKERLSDICVSRGGQAFGFKSLGRFDQQVTTKFHLDGAPEQSMLMLGYEPSHVRSRVLLADYSRAAHELGIDPERFLRDFNPMYKRGEELLGRYATELPQPRDGHSRILLINNSSLPFTEARTNALGVMHQAIISSPDDTLRRIVNSTMLALGGADDVAHEQVAEFIQTEKISKKHY